MARNERRLDIQALRGIAVLMVVAYHAGLPVPGGFLGVDVFFVISGFVIMTGLLRQLDRKSTFSLSVFLGRRARRLLPALALLLTTVCLASILLQSPLGPQQSTTRMALHATFWIANVEAYRLPTGYFDPTVGTYPLIHTWSLSVEEQFYLVFPVLVLVAWKVRTSVRTVQIVLGIGTLLSFALAQLMVTGVVSGGLSAPGRLAFYASPTRAWEFGVGALLATACRPGMSTALRHAATRRTAAVGGVVAVLVSAFALTEATPHPGAATLLPVVGTAVAIWAGSVGPAWPPFRQLVWVGDLSYSWYLWHWPFISFTAVLLPPSVVNATVAAGASLIPAWLSYKHVEAQYRTGGSHGSLRPTIIASTAISMSTAAAILLTFGAGNHWWSPTVEKMLAQTTPLPISYAAGCHEGAAPSTVVGTACEWNATGTGGAVYLVGDSNAAMYSDGLVKAAERTGEQLLVTTRSSCPLVEATVIAPRFDSTACSHYVERTLSDLEHAAPATVITAAAGNQIDDPAIALAGPDGKLTYNTRLKASIWADGFKAAIARLKAAGHRVIVMQVIPHFLLGAHDYWRPDNCPTISTLLGPSWCAPAASRATMDAAQHSVLAAIRGASSSTGVELVDLRDRLCPSGQCSAFQSGEWVYRDGRHISPFASVELAPFLRQMLAA